MTVMEKRPEARPGSLEHLNDAAITWRYIAPPGTTLEMCQRPDYFRNCVKECAQTRFAGKHAWNRIEIIAEDGTWEADLRIVSAADGLVHTRLLREWAAPVKVGRKPATPDGYVIEHIPGNGWRALDANAEVVAARLTTEDEAVRAASTHAKRKGEN